MVWRESRKKIKEMVLTNLPEGPTAVFKVTSDVLNMKIRNHGNPTDHFPELVINNFNSMVGRRVARFFASMFPHSPDFKARTVCTFHN
jgi:ribosome production factor 1